jgi:uncharacterized membrane protein YesL
VLEAAGLRHPLPSLVMVVVSYIGAALMMWYDNLGIFWVGSLLALSIGPATFVSARIMRKMGDKTTESHEINRQVDISKRKLVAGGIIFSITALLLISLSAKIPPNEEATTFMLSLSPAQARGIIWGLVLYTLAVVAFFALAALKSYPWFENFSRRLTIEASIPGHFFIALVPILCGIILILIGQAPVGISIACLSLPTILVFIAIAVRKYAGPK